MIGHIMGRERTDGKEGRKKGLECSKGIEQKKKKVQHASMK